MMTMEVGTTISPSKQINSDIQFSYSVIIPTHNEIRDLEVTVAMVWASEPRPVEIIVVDDCGEDNVKERLSSFSDVKVVRTPKRLGAGGAKRFGANLATGDVIVIMDSHMRMPYNWLSTADEALDRYPEAIFCCACINFKCKWVGCGAKWNRATTKKSTDIFTKQSWMNRGEHDVIDRCDSLLGGCYFIPRYIWGVIGGLNPLLYGWGYEEHDLSLRAWMMGFEIRRINTLGIQHRFLKELQEPKKDFPNTYSDYNAMVVSSCIFEDGVFEKLYYPFFKQVSPFPAIIQFEDAIDKVNEFREFVQAKRVYSDSDLHALCNFRLPTLKEQQEMVDCILTHRNDDTKECRRKNRNCKNCKDKNEEKKEIKIGHCGGYET